MQWGDQKWNLCQCIRSVLSFRNLLLGLTDFLWRAVWAAALRRNNCLWFLLKRDHTPDHCTHTDTPTKTYVSLLSIPWSAPAHGSSVFLSIEANQSFHSVTRSFAKHFLGVWCGAWTCFHTPDRNGLNHIQKWTASYKYSGGWKRTDCFGMQRSHSEERQEDGRLHQSWTGEWSWECQSSGRSAWLFLSQMTWTVSSILVLIKNKGHGEWEIWEVLFIGLLACLRGFCCFMLTKTSFWLSKHDEMYPEAFVQSQDIFFIIIMDSPNFPLFGFLILTYTCIYILHVCISVRWCRCHANLCVQYVMYGNICLKLIWMEGSV